MNIQDLKQEILDKSLNDDLLIFVCSENFFLAEQYVNEICEQKNLSKNFVSTLAETTDSALSLVFDYSSDMNIIKTDTFNEKAEDYNEFKNCAVICKEVDKSIKDLVSDYVVTVPKLVDWQVKAYALAICPGLSDKAIDWLYSACCKNIYKLDNELRLLSIMDKEQQLEALREMYSNPNSDLFIKESVFKLVDALIAGDTKVALQFLKHADYYSVPYTSSEGKKERDLDPVGLTSLLLGKVKNILCIKYAKGISIEELGVSSKAAYYINQQNISLTDTKKLISFLSGIDSRLKSNPSSLEFTGCRKSALLEYIILNTLAITAR